MKEILKKVQGGLLKGFLLPHSLFIIVLFAFFSCALPVSGRVEQEFVPEKDILGVSLAREGLDFFNKGRFIDAELKLRQALYLFPKADNLKLNLAVVLESSGQYEESEKLFIELLKKEPNSTKYLTGLAHAYLGAGSFKKAEFYYLKALNTAIENEDDALSAVIARSLSVLYFRIGDEQLAFCNSEFAWSFKPDEVEGVRHAKLLVAINLYKEAHDVLEKFASSRPGEPNPLVIHGLAMANFGLENFKDSNSLEDLITGASGVDPNLIFEMKLVKELSLEILQEKGEIVIPQDLDQDNTDDDKQEDEQDVLFSEEQITPAFALYLPENLLERLMNLLDEQKANEQG